MKVAIAAGNRHELRRLIEERLKDSRPPTDPRSAVPAGFSAEVDAAITVAGQSGNFQLNVMLPLIATNLLDSLALLAAASRALAEQAIRDFKVNTAGLQHALARNPILVTALNREIGYLKAAAIAKRAYAEQRPIVDVAEEMTEFDRATLLQMLDPAKLTDGGL